MKQKQSVNMHPHSDSGCREQALPFIFPSPFPRPHTNLKDTVEDLNYFLNPVKSHKREEETHNFGRTYI